MNICLIHLPLSWPLFPILPVMRKGTRPGRQTDDDLGLVFAEKSTNAAPVVFIANLYLVSGRSIGSIKADESIKQIKYATVEDMAKEWEPG